MRRPPVASVVLALALPAGAQERSAKFPVFVTGFDDAVPVVQLMIKKLNASKPFEAVGGNDSSKVSVLITCMPRKPSAAFACMYVSHHNGAAFKTFMGGGLFLAATADTVADNFLASIAQDVVERYDKTSLDSLRQALEACLLMTETKCNVPDPLQRELGAKQLTLGQYILKKSQYVCNARKSSCLLRSLPEPSLDEGSTALQRVCENLTASAKLDLPFL